MEFYPRMAFDDYFLFQGSLSKARSLRYRKNKFVPFKEELSQVDPELYAICKKYNCSNFAFIDIDLVTDNVQQKMTADLYFLDMQRNVIRKKRIKHHYNRNSSHALLYKAAIKTFNDWDAEAKGTKR
jgi:hypothetical protein